MRHHLAGVAAIALAVAACACADPPRSAPLGSGPKPRLVSQTSASAAARSLWSEGGTEVGVGRASPPGGTASLARAADAQEAWELRVMSTATTSQQPEPVRFTITEQGSALIPLHADGRGTYTGTGYYSLTATVISEQTDGSARGQCSGGGTIAASARSTGTRLTVEIKGENIGCNGSMTLTVPPATQTFPWYALPLSPPQLGPVVIEQRDNATAQVVRDVSSPPFTQHRVSQFVLTGPRDWCEEAKKMKLDQTAAGHSVGGVICIAGEARPCVWQHSRMPEIDECALEHERSHLTEVECPRESRFETSVFPTRPPPKQPQTVDANECRAYQRQLRCLEQKQSICTKPGVTRAACQREFDFFMASVKAQVTALRCH